MTSAIIEKPRLTIAESTELQRLKATIRDSSEAVDLLVKDLQSKSRQVITEAVIGGSSLARVREIVGPAHFPEWLRKNCRMMTAEQANARTVLAKSPEDLATQRGFVDALRALGALE